MTRGSCARFGVQQTPWLDYAEGIYRYRFQGTMFPEREGFFASADAGASFHYQPPGNYGDIHTGVFNGENYNRSEPNDQKAFMIRGTVRPLPTGKPVLRGIRASVFWDARPLRQERGTQPLHLRPQLTSTSMPERRLRVPRRRRSRSQSPGRRSTGKAIPSGSHRNRRSAGRRSSATTT